jgi:exopolyphosphatase
MSLRVFLEKTKQSLAKLQQQQQHSSLINTSQTVVHIVLGNEAADADSLISTLCYAFLKDQSNVNEGVVYIPAAGIPRVDLALRRDIHLAVS